MLMSARKYKIGNIYKNRKGQEFEIIDRLEDKKVRVKFKNTGFETIVGTSDILYGYVRDMLEPSICGVGIVDVKSANNHILYNRWENMIRRCYDITRKDYYRYGGIGITVCNKWHKFSNFIKDIESKENYSELVKNPKKWHIDKDLLSNENKIYSNETTLIISSSENMQERLKRNPLKTKPVIQYDLNMTKIREFESLCEASRNVGGHHSDISKCCKGILKQSKGYIWRFKENE